MKKIILCVLILSLFSNINSMEDHEPEARAEEKNELNIMELPLEIRALFIESIIKDEINKWNDISYFDSANLIAQIKILRLISKNFIVLSEEELKNCVEKLKEARFIDLLTKLKESSKEQYSNFSEEELNRKLINLLTSLKDLNLIKETLEEAVRLILAGANINIKDNRGYTALRLASQGLTGLVKLLIDQGADVDIKDLTGDTALIVVAGNGYIEIVRLLIDKGADVNLQNENGSTALMLASANGHREIVKLLIEYGADLNIKDKEGITALIFTAMQGHLEIVRLLIDGGADVNIKVGDWTASKLAASRGHTEIAKLLKSKAKTQSNSWSCAIQ